MKDIPTATYIACILNDLVSLSPEDSFKYYENAEYRAYMNETVGAHRLCLDLSCKFIFYPKIHWIQRKYDALKYKSGKIDLSVLADVYSVDLSGTNVEDVSALSNVHTLDVSYTNVPFDDPTLSGIRDLIFSDKKIKEWQHSG